MPRPFPTTFDRAVYRGALARHAEKSKEALFPGSLPLSKRQLDLLLAVFDSGEKNYMGYERILRSLDPCCSNFEWGGRH